MTAGVAPPGRTRRRAALPSHPVLGGRRAWLLIERNLLVYRRMWLVLVSGMVEPVFYLLSIGVGIGALVGDVTGSDGRPVPYAAFVAPGLLAASAMNGAILDATFNLFFKLKYAKTYDAILATPVTPADVALGEILWSLLRGLLYAASFLAVMLGFGLVHSAWAVLTLPAAVLIGFAFGAVGMAATSYMRSWQDFDWVQLAILPMFLFSATFYPLEVYPPALQAVVAATPLYQGVELMRALTLGEVGAGLLVPVGYLAAMGLAGLVVSGRRLDRLLLR